MVTLENFTASDTTYTTEWSTASTTLRWYDISWSDLVNIWDKTLDRCLEIAENLQRISDYRSFNRSRVQRKSVKKNRKSFGRDKVGNKIRKIGLPRKV